MKRGIIFDMDGTLWDSAEGVAQSWNEVLDTWAIDRSPLTAEDIHGVMGKTMTDIADILFSMVEQEERKKLLDACCSRELEYLTEHGGILYPHVEQTLQLLAKDYPLYIVSNCQSGYIEAFLSCYGLESYFKDIECFGNNGRQKGENIALLAERNRLEDAVYVGDIRDDYEASMEAGIKFIHAAYGFGTIAENIPRVQSFSELPEVVATMFPLLRICDEADT